VAIANHKIERKTEDSQWKYEVSPDGPCIFKSTQTFGRGKGPKKAVYGTVGGLLKQDTLTKADHIVVHLKLQCSTGRQFAMEQLWAKSQS
jgi:hypothetical protein